MRTKDEAEGKKKKDKNKKEFFKDKQQKFTILQVIQLTQSPGGKSRDVHGLMRWRWNRVKVLKLLFPRTPEQLRFPPSWLLTSLEFSNIQLTSLHLASMSKFLSLATLQYLTEKGLPVEKRSDLLCVNSEGKRLKKAESNIRDIFSAYDSPNKKTGSRES